MTTASPISHLMARLGLSGPDDRVADPVRTLTDHFGPGASWPPANPTCARGGAPHWRERWLDLWALIERSGHDRKTQADRFRQMQVLIQDLRGGGQKDTVLDRFRPLAAAAERPRIAGAPELPLWACPCEAGLVLVLAADDDLMAVVDTQQTALLRQLPGGLRAMMRLDAALEVPGAESPYWAKAGTLLGVTYALQSALPPSQDPLVNP